MTDTTMNLNFEKYNAGTHLLGRLTTAICLLLFLGVPFIMGLYLGVAKRAEVIGGIILIALGI